MKGLFRKLLVLLLVFGFCLGLLPDCGATGVSAADKTVRPETPKISLSAAANGTGIKVTVGKTENADGYRIYIRKYGSEEFKWIRTLIAKDGKERKYTIRNLEPTAYEIRVRAYRKVNGKKKSGNYCEEQLISLAVRETVTLGNWIPKNYSGKDCVESSIPLEWIIIDRSEDGKQALVVSKYLLCYRQFHNKDEEITWENCSLRKWLNEDFLKEAFTEEEQARIRLTQVKTEDNPMEFTKGGNDTEDRIFLLSGSEAEKYFDDGNWNAFKGAFMGYYDPEEDYCSDESEWLRTPGRQPANMEDYWDLDPEDRDEEFEDDWMNGYASFYFGGDYVDYEGTAVVLKDGVRPAFWIDLE